MSGEVRQPGEKGWAHPNTMIGRSTSTPPLAPDLYHPFVRDGKRCTCGRKRGHWIHVIPTRSEQT